MTTAGSTFVLKTCFLTFVDKRKWQTCNSWIFEEDSRAAQTPFQRKCISLVLPSNCSGHLIVLQYNKGVKSLVWIHNMSFINDTYETVYELNEHESCMPKSGWIWPLNQLTTTAHKQPLPVPLCSWERNKVSICSCSSLGCGFEGHDISDYLWNCQILQIFTLPHIYLS